MEDDMSLLEITATDHIFDKINSGQLISSPDSALALLIAWRQEVLEGICDTLEFVLNGDKG